MIDNLKPAERRRLVARHARRMDRHQDIGDAEHAPGISLAASARLGWPSSPG